MGVRSESRPNEIEQSPGSFPEGTAERRASG